MNKRYQAFVSSTFKDLEEERKAVMIALMKLNVIPAGMEDFPSSNEEQMELIHRVIDSCDFYILIVAGMYGSTDDDGISYTEKEYEYAISKGVEVLSFIRKDDGMMLDKYVEKDVDKKVKLEAFRRKISAKKTVSFWTDVNGLVLQVSTSLAQAITRTNAPGWIRGDSVATVELLNDYRKLSARKDELEVELAELKEQLGDTNLLSSNLLDEIINVGINYYEKSIDGFSVSGAHLSADRDISLLNIFICIASDLIDFPSNKKARHILSEYAKIFNFPNDPEFYSFDIADHSFEDIRYKLLIYELIEVKPAGEGLSKTPLWSLTKKGLKTLAAFNERNQKLIDGDIEESAVDEN